MLDTKSPFQSLTVNSILIGLIVQVLALFGVQIAPETAAAIGASINSIIVGVTMLLALYGRLRARKAIAVGGDPTVLRSPVLVSVVVLMALFLAGCAPALASIGQAPPQPVAPQNTDRLEHVRASLAGLEAATDAAIAAGLLAAREARAARDRVDELRGGLVIAEAVASVSGPEFALRRVAALERSTAAASAELPVLFEGR